MHDPAPSHCAMPLQTLPSSQFVPGGAKGYSHIPVPGLQAPAKRQGPGGPQITGVPGAHNPFMHLSAVVHVLLSSHTVPFGFLLSVGQLVDVPVQDSARSQSVAAARQVTPALPAGCWQIVLDPLHLSAVHTLPSSVQPVPFALGEQVPAKPVELHAPHSSKQAVSQQTPLTQNPDAHCDAAVQDLPRDGS